MSQGCVKLKQKLTKSGQPQKLRVSLWMSPADKEMILNRKTDSDLSTNIFLIRVIRRYFTEHEGVNISGVRGLEATNHKTPPTPLPTLPIVDRLLQPPTVMEGNSLL